MVLPILYIRDSKGKIRQWTVWTEGADIIVEHGVQGGKLQKKRTTAKPKNVGKANATTAEQQAELEARSKWTAQVEREDYHEDVELAGRQTRPMLAHDYHKVGHRVKWGEVVAQPKLDGLRLVAGDRYRPDDPGHRYTGEFEMLTRKGETHNVAHLVPHAKLLLELVNKILTDDTCLGLDGEVYLHGRPLPWINSRAKKYYKGETESLEYHIFDLVIPGMGFMDRYRFLTEAMNAFSELYGETKLKLVPIDALYEQGNRLLELHGKYVEAGYEGLMIRHVFGQYAIGDRSADLFKFKQFQDEECQIIEVWEDLNNNAMLTVQRKNGVTVDVTPKRTHEERKAMLEQGDLLGRWITVKYQAETPDGSLQFPVGLDIRECNEAGEPIV